MATATLELVNPYSKYGFKRRPTYDEIIGLINENETITGQLPDRTATLYKASPEGSFFDGTDALELLKEQQSRILQRQMQDLLLRQTIRNNGGTFNLERHRQSSSNTSSSAEVQPDRSTLPAQVQADLQQREQQLRNRQQQTGDASQSFLQRTTSLPVISGMLSSLRSGARSVGGTPMHRNAEHFDLTANDPPPEDISSSSNEGEMMTARTDIPNDHIMDTLFFTNNNTSEEALQSAYNVLVKYKHVSPEIMSQNFRALNNIYNTLLDTGFITQTVWRSYYKKTNELAEHTNKIKQNKVREEIVDNYKRNIYDKFINPATSSGS